MWCVLAAMIGPGVWARIYNMDALDKDWSHILLVLGECSSCYSEQLLKTCEE